MKITKGKFILCDITEWAEWLNATIVSREILRIQNHHTWKPSYADFHNTNHFSLLEGMEDAHLSRGFAEIGQNLTTFPDGTVAVCRPLDTIPAGCKGANTGGICIEHIGNFDKDMDTMSTQHRTAILKINALLCKKFNLLPNTDTLIYHYWYDLTTGERKNGAGNTKSCPGTHFFGGNTVADAEMNFIPLVMAELQSESNIVPIPAEPIIFTGKVIATHLNVRVAPNASSKKVNVLKKGVVLHAYEKSGNWYRIVPHQSYWVNLHYLEEVTPTL